jgi:hypothetical protein
MTNRQLTILLGNSAADLGRVLDRISAEGIDIRAHCLVDNGDGNCKLRMIVSDADRAVSLLKQRSVAVVVNEVLMVETDDEPGGLSRLLALFGETDIPIEYSYTAAGGRPGTAPMVFRFSDNERAAAIFARNGIPLLPSEA